MPQACNISICDSTSVVLCFCCNQYLCREHFVEHDYLLRSKLNDLTEQINNLSDQLEIFDINKMANDFHQKLDKWRFHSHTIIDIFYEKKCQELNHYINKILNKQEENINDLKLKIAKMINVQQTTHNNIKLFLTNIKTLQEQMNQIKHMSIQLDISPLIIDDNLIDINISNLYQLDLSRLSPPYQIIDCVPLRSNAMASNNQYLLLHQNSHLYLIDENLFIIKENKWPNDWIRDMCWSEILKSFFIITLDNVYLVQENTLSIKHIKTIEGRFWQSCTCSNTSLYLSKDTWNSSIDEFSLKPSIEFIKYCKRIETIDNKQRIDSIKYSNETLALAINDQTKQEIFIELRSISNFDRLWLCQFNIEYNEGKIQCCLFNYNSWIIADWGSSSLYYITNDGNIKNKIQYEYDIHHVNVFGRDKLVISTNNSINFHKL